MEECGSTLNIVILDCCRDNPCARSWRSASTGLAEMKALQETLIAYATAPGKAASDGEGSNSPYSQALSDEILRPGVKLQDVFLNVARRVHATTKGEQRPWTASDLLSEFVFVSAGPAPAQASVSPPQPPQTAIPADSPPSTVYSLDELFESTRYENFDSYSRAAALRKAQEKLKAAGLYKSSVDGKSGSGTCAAIREWQTQHGIQANGALTTETLATLGLDKEVASKPPERSKSSPVTTNANPGSRPAPAPAGNGGLQYGTPIQGKAGFVQSPHARNAGAVDVRGIHSGTKVRCPYTSKIFYVP
jgi:peptidoglycan hydrolase-like protein with peptidoglycan-binding domain